MGYDSDEEMTGKDPYQDDLVLGQGDEDTRLLDDPNDMPVASANGYAAAPPEQNAERSYSTHPG